MNFLSLNLVIFSLIQQQPFIPTEGHQDAEPQITCVSKYDYDYKTLQKVVEMEQTQKELMKTVADQQKTIAGLTELGKISDVHVAFSAIISPRGLTDLRPGETVIFDKVITNVGGAYHNLSGIFTAPVGGIYVFNMDIMVRAEQRQYVEFVRNGIQEMKNYGNAVGGRHYASSSRLVTLQLSVGDNVWIRTIDTSNHGDGVIHGNRFSTFSGWLVAAIPSIP